MEVHSLSFPASLAMVLLIKNKIAEGLFMFRGSWGSPVSSRSCTCYL